VQLASASATCPASATLFRYAGPLLLTGPAMRGFGVRERMSAAEPRRAVALRTVLFLDKSKRSARRALQYLLPEGSGTLKSIARKRQLAAPQAQLSALALQSAAWRRRLGWRCLTYRRKRIGSVPGLRASRPATSMAETAMCCRSRLRRRAWRGRSKRQDRSVRNIPDCINLRMTPPQVRRLRTRCAGFGSSHRMRSAGRGTHTAR
jgi:hypothetical protein